MIWFVSFLLVCYFVPSIKVIHLIVRRVLFLRRGWVPKSPLSVLTDGSEKSLWTKLSRSVAGLEYYVAPFRQWVVGWPFVGFYFYKLAFHLVQGQPINLWFLSLGFWVSLVVIMRPLMKSADDLKLAEFVRQNPEVHPQVFFERYQLQLAFGGVSIRDLSGRDLIPGPVCDFRKGQRARLKKAVWFRGLIDTGYLSHMGLRVLKALGQEYLCEVFDPLASLWGKRILQWGESAFRLENTEALKGLTGHNILIFNHKSSLDFVLSYFALTHLKFENRRFKPRFLLAKDHFKDNKFMHTVLGMGLVSDAVGMVFLERKDQQKSFQNLKQAAEAIVVNSIDLAVYPQGTRSKPNFDRSGKRRDSGYYTTVNQHDLKSNLSHLKKGTAYLVLDTLQEIHKRGERENLNLIFVGVKGAGQALPKGSLDFQTETEIAFSVGPVVTLKAEPILKDWGFDENLPEEELCQRRKEFALGMNQLIDQNLSGILGIHSYLSQRYLTELKGQFRFDDGKIEEVSLCLKNLGAGHTVVYQILDRIYCLPVKRWNGYLSELSQLLLERTSEERLQMLLEEVSEELLKVA